MSKQKSADRFATFVFRFFVGCFGLAILALFLLSQPGWNGVSSFLAVAAGLGLLLGYAFGGDKWGAKLFSFFSGIKLPDGSKKSGGRGDAGPKRRKKKRTK
jgi:hypothetical protein